MPFILFSLTLVGLSAIGLGWLLFALCRWLAPVFDPDALTLGEVGIAGLWLAALLAGLIHFLLPLGGMSSLFLLLLGHAMLLRQWRQTRRLWRRLRMDGRCLTLALLALAGAAITMQVRGPAFYDTGLYHLQQIMMQGQAPLILGAANIHMRFGYNSLLYPLSGGFNLPGLGLATALTIVPLLFIFTTAAIAERALGSLLPLPRRFGLLLLPLFFTVCLGRGWVASPVSDVATCLLVGQAAFLLSLLVCGRRLQSGATAAALLLMVALSASLAVTVKLSALPALGLALLALPAAAPLLRARPPARRMLLPAILLPGLLGLVWAVRGLLLSGCLAYPLVDSCLPGLAWTVPAEMAQQDLAMMRLYARAAGGDAAPAAMGGVWLQGWLAAARTPLMLVALLLTGLVLAAPALRWTGRRDARTALAKLAPPERRLVLALGAVLLAGLLFWFTAAPLWRYGFCFILPALALTGASLWPVTLRTTPGRRRGLGLAMAPLGLLLMGMLVGMVRHEESWPKLRETPVAAVTNRHGVQMFQPQGDDRCWNAPFPCVPEPNGDLRLTRLGPFPAALSDREGGRRDQASSSNSP